MLPEKRVTFNNTVKVMYFDKVANDDNICWPLVARDRMRFKRRALDVEQKIGYVFAPQHRNRMFNLIYL